MIIRKLSGWLLFKIIRQTDRHPATHTHTQLKAIIWWGECRDCVRGLAKGTYLH